MKGSIRGQLASDHLNLLRGLAAVAVLIYHLRYRFFLDYSDIETPTLGVKAFFACTAFGHDAVIVFFVLSGYFISSSVVSSVGDNRWSWTSYLTSRLTRLYLVLIPGLLLTAAWDSIGLRWFDNHPIYTGEKSNWTHDFFAVSERLTPSTFLGNTFFLQTAHCLPFGSNDPLWSLAYEFWYYLLFPGIVLLLWPKVASWQQRLLASSFLIFAIAVMSRLMLIYFPVWLLGWLAARLPRLALVGRFPGIASLISLAGFGCGASACHLDSVRQAIGGSTIVCDYVTGTAFMFALWIVLHDTRAGHQGVYRYVATGLSDMSYTLYVVHMPLLVFIRAAVLPDEPWSPNATSLTVALLLGAGCLAYAWCLAQLTEANTAKIRTWLASLVDIRRKAQAIPLLSSTDAVIP